MTKQADPVRLVFVSNTHLQHLFDVPTGDILIHCGDLTLTGTLKEVEVFGRWFAALPHKHKIVVAGNHDTALQHWPEAARDILTSLLYLEDSGTTVEGVKIWGAPWTQCGGDTLRAFSLPPGAPLAQKWDRIPHNVDVLITHGPPYGILDLAPTGYHLGDPTLLEAVSRVKPIIHAFGNVQGDRGLHVAHGRLYANVAICNETYNAKHAPVVIDFVPRTRSSIGGIAECGS